MGFDLSVGVKFEYSMEIEDFYWFRFIYKGFVKDNAVPISEIPLNRASVRTLMFNLEGPFEDEIWDILWNLLYQEDMDEDEVPHFLVCEVNDELREICLFHREHKDAIAHHILDRVLLDHNLYFDWNQAGNPHEEIDDEAFRIVLKGSGVYESRCDRGWHLADQPLAWGIRGVPGLNRKEAKRFARRHKVKLGEIPLFTSGEKQKAKVEAQALVDAFGFKVLRPMGSIAYSFISGG